MEEVALGGRSLRVPTADEILRVKAWLVLRRNATRDYLDVVALADRMGLRKAAKVVVGMDEYYEDQIGPRWRVWENVASDARSLATEVLDAALEDR